MKKYIVIFIGLILVSACKTKKVPETTQKVKEQTTLINFVESNQLVPVLEIAVKEKKPVFLYLHTTWCTPCRFMEKEVFSFQSSADYMNEKFVNYEVDMEKENGPDLSIIYGVKTIPTLLILDHKGNELSRHTGGIGNEKLIQWSSELLTNYVPL